MRGDVPEVFPQCLGPGGVDIGEVEGDGEEDDSSQSDLRSCEEFSAGFSELGAEEEG